MTRTIPLTPTPLKPTISQDLHTEYQNALSETTAHFKPILSQDLHTEYQNALTKATAQARSVTKTAKLVALFLLPLLVGIYIFLWFEFNAYLPKYTPLDYMSEEISMPKEPENLVGLIINQPTPVIQFTVTAEVLDFADQMCVAKNETADHLYYIKDERTGIWWDIEKELPVTDAFLIGQHASQAEVSRSSDKVAGCPIGKWAIENSIHVI